MFSNIQRRKTFFLAADVILIVFSVFASFLLRFEGQIPEKYVPNALGLLVLTLAILLPFFYIFRLYSFSWSYVSAPELISLAKAIFASFLFLVAAIFIFRDLPVFIAFPRSTIFISLILVFIFSGGIRFAKRAWIQALRRDKKEKEKTLIAGAGDAGEQILRSILSFRDSPYSPAGFVDDDNAKQGVSIQGINVLGRVNDIPEIVKRENIEGMIIAFPSAGSAGISRAVELGRKAKLKKIRIIPPLGEIISGEITIGNLRDVQMEDLLGREPLSLDKTVIENFLRGKRVMVTGAAGSIGSELCRQLAKFFPSRLLMIDQDETGIFNITEEIKDNFPDLDFRSFVSDIRDKEKINCIFSEFKPEIVFHAAAYKHVPLMEQNYDEAIKNNIFGAKNLADVSLAEGVEKFVFISTDKAINPTSVMGATKRFGEMICQVKNQEERTKFVSVRFGNVLDSRGSVIPTFREQIKRGGPLEITHPEMKRYFMTASEACLLVMQAGAMGRGGEVFVLDMGKPIKILDLAKEMIRLSGLEPDKNIPIVFTQPRPGEKLFEEILSAEEGIIATQNQKIFIAKLSLVSREKLDACFEKLEDAITGSDKQAAIGALKELIPNYQANQNQ